MPFGGPKFWATAIGMLIIAITVFIAVASGCTPTKQANEFEKEVLDTEFAPPASTTPARPQATRDTRFGNASPDYVQDPSSSSAPMSDGHAHDAQSSAPAP